MPQEATSAAEALHLADERMYEQKESRPDSPRQQTRELLLQILRERALLLGEGNEVPELARRVGRRLRLGGEQLDELTRAAELHDIGRMAIPDAILGKAGPLNEEEIALVRRHPLIGERILDTVPSMKPVARIVRATHERFDGNGHPDGLIGEAIPLAARIIAACDACAAMRLDRPWRVPLSSREALVELRRMAGFALDPRVVEALAAELTYASSEPAAQDAQTASGTQPEAGRAKSQP